MQFEKKDRSMIYKYRVRKFLVLGLVYPAMEKWNSSNCNTLRKVICNVDFLLSVICVRCLGIPGIERHFEYVVLKILFKNHSFLYSDREKFKLIRAIVSIFIYFKLSERRWYKGFGIILVGLSYRLSFIYRPL